MRNGYNNSVRALVLAEQVALTDWATCRKEESGRQVAVMNMNMISSCLLSLVAATWHASWSKQHTTTWPYVMISSWKSALRLLVIKSHPLSVRQLYGVGVGWGWGGGDGGGEGNSSNAGRTAGGTSTVGAVEWQLQQHTPLLGTSQGSESLMGDHS